MVQRLCREQLRRLKRSNSAKAAAFFTTVSRRVFRLAVKLAD